MGRLWYLILGPGLWPWKTSTLLTGDMLLKHNKCFFIQTTEDPQKAVASRADGYRDRNTRKV